MNAARPLDATSGGMFLFVSGVQFVSMGLLWRELIARTY